MGNEVPDLRKRIEGKVGHRLYNAVWNRVVRDYGSEPEPELLEEIENMAEDWQEFAEEIKKECEGESATQRRHSTDSVKFLEEGSDVMSVLMAESFNIDSVSRVALVAVSEFAALEAGEHPKVVEFRNRVLGREYLSTEQANILLQSPAARFLTIDQIHELNIPLTGHSAYLLGPYEDNDQGGIFDHEVTIRVEPPGTSLRLRYTNAGGGSEDEEVLVRCLVEGDRAIAPYKIGLPPEDIQASTPEDLETDLEARGNMGPAQISGFDTAYRPANVWPGSLVDEIHVLAQGLSETFMWPSRTTGGPVGAWWNRASVTLFLLTGIAPLIHPVKVSIRDTAGEVESPTSLILEVLPWVPPESLVELYKSVREQLGIKVRNRGDRKFEVVTFVLRRSKTLDLGTSEFKQLCETWNTEFPEKKFRDINDFSRDFERGLEAVKKRYSL